MANRNTGLTTARLISRAGGGVVSCGGSVRTVVSGGGGARGENLLC